MLLGRSEAYRSTIQRPVHAPSDIDDESILAFVRKNLGQGYHILGTCKVGRVEDPESVVGTDFKVIGVQGLRIANLSVYPVLTCNHTQIQAYLIGMKYARAVLQNGRSEPVLEARL